MTAADLLDGLVRVNLAAGAAILVVIALRKIARVRFGARLAYGLWLLPVLAGAAVLAPARHVVIVRPAAASHIALSLATPPLHSTLEASATLATTSLDARVLLIGLWLMGVAGAALVMAGLQHRFMRQARRGALGPAVVGVIAPRIVTPNDFAERYSPGEQALVLAHEQAHIARQDSRLNGLCAAMQCLCWFNPLVHLAARLMRIDQELACDEAVVSRFPAARRAYAEVLVKAQLAILPLPLGCYWPSKTQHPLVERVAMLKLKDISRARRWAGASALALLCAGAGVAAWAAQPADVRITLSPIHDGMVAQPSPAPAVAAPPAKIATGDGLKAHRPDRTQSAPAPVQIAAADGPADQTPQAAAAPPHAEAFGALGPISISAEQLNVAADQHLATWTGHVEAVYGPHHLGADAINAYFAAKPGSGAAPGNTSSAGALQKMVADGHVTFVSGSLTAKADQAVYDTTSNTIVFTGNVVLGQGGTELRDDKLIINLGTDHAATADVGPDTLRRGPSPGTEDSVRRWLVSIQAHQPDYADMAPGLEQAARQQSAVTNQIVRAFGGLGAVRFVGVTPQGMDTYEADFAHGKLRVVIAPLAADGRVTQLSWAPIGRSGDPKS